MLNLYVQPYDTCFCICICIGDLGLWPSFPENSHLLKGQLALASSTTPVAPYCLLHQCHHCPQQRLGLVHCLPPHICLCVLPFSYPCILWLLLLLHTWVTITFVLYCDLQNVTVVPFCWELQQGLAKGPIFLMGDKSGCLLLDGSKYTWCCKSTTSSNTCKVLPDDTGGKYYQASTTRWYRRSVQPGNLCDGT